MHATHSAMAVRWEKETKGKRLPEKAPKGKTHTKKKG
jgi:hypothetical protein